MKIRGFFALGAAFLLLLYGHIALAQVEKSFAPRVEVDFANGDLAARFREDFGDNPAAAGLAVVCKGKAPSGEFDVLATTENYPFFGEIELTAGSFFSREAVRAKMKLAVLDESLAARLFPDETPLGKEISLDGAAYQIVGICRQKSLPFSAPAPTVYVPLGSAAPPGDGPASVYLSAAGEDSALLSAAVEQARTRYGPAQCSVVDYANYQAIAAQSLSLLAGWAELLTAVFLVGLLVCIGQREAAKLRQGLKREYPAGYVRRHAVDLMLSLNGALLCALLAAFFFYLAGGLRLVFPQGLLTSATLFDLGHYQTWFADLALAIRRAGAAGLPLARFTARTLPGCYGILLAECAVLLVLYLGIFARIRRKLGFRPAAPAAKNRRPKEEKIIHGKAQDNAASFPEGVLY